MDGKTGATGVYQTQLEADIDAIKNLMKRYTWSLDSKDWEKLESCFTDDIVFEASDMGRHPGARNLIEKFQTRVVRVPIRRHSVYNPYVRVDGDTAEFTAYILNSRMRPRAPGGDFSLAGGYYRNSFRRENGQWKMSALRWHGFFIEGNPRLDPKLPSGPAPEPVMTGPKDSPWGGANAKGGAPDVSASLQVRDLYTGMIRALDAGVAGDVAAAFTTDAKANLQGDREVAGAQAISEAFTAAGGDRWTMHVLSNEKLSVVGEEARFGTYVYKVAPDGNGKYAHTGGIMTGVARRTQAGWKIAECSIHFLWDRAVPLFEDPIKKRPEVAALVSWLWEHEAERDKGTVQDEVTALLWKYTWSFDLYNREQNADCFAEDVDVAITLDSTARHYGRDDWTIANLAGRQRQMVTLHYVSNVVVTETYNPDIAEIKAYVTTRRTAPGEPGRVMIAGGHYFGTAERVNGKWQFATFSFVRSHGAFE